MAKPKLRTLPGTSSTELGDYPVTVRNALNMAAQGFKTINEKRIIMACIAKIDSATFDELHKRHVVHLSVAEFAATFPAISKDEAYDLLRKTLPGLRKREFRREEKTPQGVKVHEDAWISGTTYMDKKGWLELRFTPEATPFLLAIRGDFTSYVLKQASGLRSLHSWRLLELLMQYKDTGWRQVSIEDFGKALEVNPGYLKNFANMRRRVIEPAIKELTEKDGWLIEWEPIKEGAKVTQLRFTFKRHPQGRLDLDLVDTVPEEMPPLVGDATPVPPEKRLRRKRPKT
jgi:plasmid replication initiation protein